MRPQVYFLQEPHLDFDLGGAASILDMPGLNGLLKDAIQQQVGYFKMKHTCVCKSVSNLKRDWQLLITLSK